MPRVREFRVSYHPHPTGVTCDRRKIADPKSAAAVFVPLLCNEAQEVFVIALLDVRHRLMGIHEISRGGLTSTEVDPRIVFRAALLADAAAIMLAHNHPSGDPTPSPEDHQITARLIAAGRLLGIEVLDHVIVGERQYCSFKETGRI